MPLAEEVQLPPPVAVHETNVTCDGRVSVATTSLAAFGPALCSVSVYSTVSPGSAAALDTSFVRLTSADGGGASYAPMSECAPCGRDTPRWSVDSAVPSSPASTAGLASTWIAIVGVSPGALSCSGPSCGSDVTVMAGQPELSRIRFAAEPVVVTGPATMHPCVPLFATI